MNRFHVHLHVRDVGESVHFYSTLFGAQPSRREADYAKWMLDNPRVNFAISATGNEVGLGHFGFQVEDAQALSDVTARAKSAAGQVLVEQGANCCYAVGDKAWAEDPQGVRWEAFQTTGDLTVYGVGADETRLEGTGPAGTATQAGCCAADAPRPAVASPIPCCSANR